MGVATLSGYEVRWLLDRKTLIHDAGGRPSEIGGVAQDITERKRAEAQIQRLHALREIDAAIMRAVL